MIELIDHMGSDLTVVNSARVSFNKNKEELDGQDERLIKYLLKHNHWTPFSHPMVTVRIKMPIFVARQWFKHTVGFSRNEVSRRYVDHSPEYFLPNELRLKAKNKKQGSSEEASTQSPQIKEEMIKFYKQCDDMYNMMLSCNICPEQARMILPQATVTEFYETASLAAYLRLIGLRMDDHAQKETRQFADKINAIIAKLFPVTYKVWVELNAEKE